MKLKCWKLFFEGVTIHLLTYLFYMYFYFTSIQGYFPAALIHSRNFSSVLFGCLLVAHRKKSMSVSIDFI